jgi:hypothetical protein
MRTFGMTVNVGIAFRVKSLYKESLNPTCVLSEWPKVQVLHLGLGYFKMTLHMHIDALLSPGVKPTWGFHFGQVAESWDLGHAPGFQHWKGVEGRVGSLGIKLGRGTSLACVNLHPKKNQPHEVSLAFGTPLGVGTSHGHFDTQDSTRPGLGGSHHLPPYSILCSSPWSLHPNGTFCWDSRNGVPKLSRRDFRNFERP